MKSHQKLVIQDRHIYLDEIPLKGVVSYAMSAKHDGSKTPILLTVTLLVDSEVSVYETGDQPSSDLSENVH